MATHQIHVMIPEDHRLLVEVPATVRSGPATLILVTPSESETGSADAPPESTKLAAQERWQAMRAELASSPRSFRQLSPEERSARLSRLRGIGQGLLTSSEEMALRKAEEIEIEERKFAR